MFIEGKREQRLDLMAADPLGAAFSERKSGVLGGVERTRSLDTFQTG